MPETRKNKKNIPLSDTWQPESRQDSLHGEGETIPPVSYADNAARYAHPMPQIHTSSLTGLPMGLPGEMGILPGDMPLLYDLWGLWS